MEKRKPKPVFVQGPILPEKIASSIASHQSKTDIHEHSIFLGQVQQEEENGNSLQAVDFNVDESSFEDALYNIRESAFEKFNLSCLHMYHSLGEVKVGEIHFFVFTSSPIEKQASEASSYLVDEFKSKIVISTTKRF